MTEEELAARIDVLEAKGGAGTPAKPTAPAAPDAPAEPTYAMTKEEVMELGRLRAEEKARLAAPAAPPPEPTTADRLYVSPGGPSAAPEEPALNPMDWTQDDIARLQADGTFLKKVEQWRERIESGGNAVF